MMNNRYMRQMNDYLEGGQGSAPRQNGAFANMVPRQTMIRDQPHMLAYINPTEEQMLRDMGGSGLPGPDGIPAYDHGGFHLTDPSTYNLDSIGQSISNVGSSIKDTASNIGSAFTDTVKEVVTLGNADTNTYNGGNNEITTSYLDSNDVAHSTRADADAADAVINTTATTAAALPIDYQTTPSGSVFFVDEFGVNQYVGGGNWGQGNPSQALTDYLGSDDHLGALTETGPVATSLSTNPNVTSFKGLVDDGFGGEIYGTQDLDGRITYYPNGDADGDGRMSDEEKTAAAQSGSGFPTLKDATDYLGYSAATGALTNVGTAIPTFDNYKAAIDAGYLNKEVIINGQKVIAQTADGYTGEFTTTDNGEVTTEVSTGTDTGTGTGAGANPDQALLDAVATNVGKPIDTNDEFVFPTEITYYDSAGNAHNTQAEANKATQEFTAADLENAAALTTGTETDGSYSWATAGVDYNNDGEISLVEKIRDSMDGAGSGGSGPDYSGGLASEALNALGVSTYDRNAGVVGPGSFLDVLTDLTNPFLFPRAMVSNILTGGEGVLPTIGDIIGSAVDNTAIGEFLLGNKWTANLANSMGITNLSAEDLKGEVRVQNPETKEFETYENINKVPISYMLGGDTATEYTLASNKGAAYSGETGLITGANGEVIKVDENVNIDDFIDTNTGVEYPILSELDSGISGQGSALEYITNNENITNVTNVTNVTNEAAPNPLETKILTEERPIDQVFERLKRYNSGYLPAYMQKWITDNSIDELVRKIVGEDGETYYITPDGRYLTADQFENTINVGSKSFATGSETVETGYTVLDTNTGILETYDTEDNLISTVGPDTVEETA
tara:strand:+ start:165 stop:2699 length:2535 start_codon:yes stop_codon:yes gene_type:complete